MAPARILVVCTANVCRSPMAAALLARHLGEQGIAASVSSAGTRATDLPVDPLAVAVLGERGLDLSRHVPRVVTRELVVVDGADLIVTMTREHLREVVLGDRAAWPRSFTLREVVRRAGTVAIATRRTGWVEWLAEVAAGRRPSDVLGNDRADDVADPYGLGPAEVRRTAAELERLTSALAGLIPR